MAYVPCEHARRQRVISTRTCHVRQNCMRVTKASILGQVPAASSATWRKMSDHSSGANLGVDVQGVGGILGGSSGFGNVKCEGRRGAWPPVEIRATVRVLGIRRGGGGGGGGGGGRPRVGLDQGATGPGRPFVADCGVTRCSTSPTRWPGPEGVESVISDTFTLCSDDGADDRDDAGPVTPTRSSASSDGDRATVFDPDSPPSRRSPRRPRARTRPRITSARTTPTTTPTRSATACHMRPRRAHARRRASRAHSSARRLRRR
jgi:hypothetical protein